MRVRALAVLAAAIATGLFAQAMPSEALGPSHSTSIDDWLSPYVDYSPSGVPDFSTCRPEWSRPSTDPGRPGQWTHAAPVALANALWWLDSRAETGTDSPPGVSDTHPLVTSYPYFGPKRDDHAKETVGPLVRDLAARANTDGLLIPVEGRGTAWGDFVAGAQDYVASRGLKDAYELTSRRAPDHEWIQEHLDSDAAIVLLLGAWEQSAEGWGRIGGHYVTVAGTGVQTHSEEGAFEGARSTIGVSDPLADRAATTGEGRIWPESPAEHSCRLAPREHDDAQAVSHDEYRLDTALGLPDERAVLDGYFDPSRASEVMAFAGQNSDAVLEVLASDWRGGVPVMAMDAALAIQPRVAPGRSPTNTPAPSPTDLPPTLPPLATARSTAPSPASPTPLGLSTTPPQSTSIFIPLASRGTPLFSPH